MVSCTIRGKPLALPWGQTPRLDSGVRGVRVPLFIVSLKPLLCTDTIPVAPDRAESELEASVEKLFDEGGSGNQTEQGDSAEGGQDANIQLSVEAADIAVEDVALVQPRRQGKRKYVIADAVAC
ncbi:hypothetical protein Tco_0065614 [Tanacetum coccineum]